MTLHQNPVPAAVAPPSVDARISQAGIRFVEFFGLPGIGKTTASSLLAKELRRCGLTVDESRTEWENRTAIGRQAYRFGLAAPKLTDRAFRSLLARIARFVSEGEQESTSDLLRVTWNLYAVVAYVLDRRRPGTSVTVVDQGLLQGFWSVLLKSRRRRTSETWLDILSAIGVEDTLFVHLRGDAGLAQDRLLARGDRSSRVQRASAGSEIELWRKADRACREMAVDLARGARGFAPVLATLDVEPTASPEEMAEKSLEAVLSACLERHRLRIEATATS